MRVLEQMSEKLGLVKAMLRGKWVGVYPSDLGRYRRDLSALLNGLDVVGVLVEDSWVNTQGLHPIADREIFLNAVDVILAWGRDPGTLAFHSDILRRGFKGTFINLLDPAEPLSLLRSGKPLRVLKPEHRLVNVEENYLRSTGVNLRSLYPYLCVPKSRLDAFSEQALSSGAAAFACPHCGQPVSTVHSFVVNGEAADQTAVFHAFRCCKEFHVISFMCFPTFALYVPDDEVAIVFNSVSGVHVDKGFGYPIPQLVESFKTCAWYYQDETKRYLEGPSRGLRGIVRAQPYNIHINFVGNLNAAHIFASSSPHLREMQVIQPGMSGYVRAGVAQFGVAVSSVKGADDARRKVRPFLDGLNSNMLNLLVMTGDPISPEVCQAWVAYAREEIPYRSHRAMEEAATRKPLLMVTLRHAFRRNWASQEEGLAEVINRLAKLYPEIGVVFDGVQNYCNQTPLDTVVQGIRNRLSPSVATFDATDVSVQETIAWASRADLYLGPSGSGALFPIIASLPMVLYGPASFNREAAPEIDGAPVIQGMTPGVCPLRLVDSREENFRRDQYISYELDHDAIFAAVLDLLPAGEPQ